MPSSLPRLSNADYERVETLATLGGISLDQCPTCLTRPTEVAPDNFVRIPGTYRYKGETYPCDCEQQIQLRKHYLLANIGDQYQRLDWAEFSGTVDASDAIETYLGEWPSFRHHGMGLEFTSTRLGTGKTFAATHVGKELIKRGERVYFIPFLEVISLYSRDDRDEQEERLRDTTVLILDEVVPPYTTAQERLFASKFEELIRHRTNFNLPTVMTTNIEPAKLREVYPRPYSLLEAKQVRIRMDGEDARVNFIASENLELAMNGEVRKIT